MKKLLTLATFALLIFNVYLHASRPVTSDAMQNESYLTKDISSTLYYNGPKDNTFWANAQSGQYTRYNAEDEYHDEIRKTTLGILACLADVIGVGRVTNQIDRRSFVVVEHAFVGCTNGQSLVLYEWSSKADIHFENYEYMPTNNSWIVFAYIKDLSPQYIWPIWVDNTGKSSYSYKHYLRQSRSPASNHYSSSNINRCWWYADRDDGELLNQFTNLLQAVRFEPNWTNYYNLCQQAVLSPSNRVREDAYWDMCGLVWNATHKQEHMMNDSPLVDPKIKTNLLFRKDWISEETREKKELPAFYKRSRIELPMNSLGIAQYVNNWRIKNEEILQIHFPHPEYYLDSDSDPDFESKWKKGYYYFFSTDKTPLGMLAEYADVIGVGVVSQLQDNYFTVTVDHALIGCTNGASIPLTYTGKLRDKTNLGGNVDPNKPVKNNRILFAANINYTVKGAMPDEPTSSPEETLTHQELPYFNRLCWNVSSDMGILYKQFTNVFQAVRIDYNWTNYYHLCRDGANSTSERVREDSELDLWGIVFTASLEQKRFLDKEPGLPEQFKEYLYDYFLEHDYDKMEFWPSCGKSHEIKIFNQEQILAAFMELKKEMKKRKTMTEEKAPVRGFFNLTYLIYLFSILILGRIIIVLIWKW